MKRFAGTVQRASCEWSKWWEQGSTRYEYACDLCRACNKALCDGLQALHKATLIWAGA